MPDHLLITPYNFVPLVPIVAGTEPPPRNEYHAQRYTGSFEYEVKTLTPIYTRAATKVRWDAPDPIQTRSQQPFDFFHRGDPHLTPVLPGSSLRGMFRSVFEILTNSRIEFVSKRRLFYRSFADTTKSGKGMLYRENYDFKALRAGIVTNTPDGGLTLNTCRSATAGFVVISIQDPMLVKLHTMRTQEKLGVPLAIAQGDGSQAAPVKRDTFKKVRVSVLLKGHEITLFGAPNDKTGNSGMKVPEAELCDPDTVDSVEGWLIVPGPEVNRDRERIPKRRWHQVVLIPDAASGFDSYDIPKGVELEYEAWGDTAHGHKFKEQVQPLKVPRKVNRNHEPAFAMLDSQRGNVSILGANMMLPIAYQDAIDKVVQVNYRQLHGKGTIPTLDMADAVFGRVHEKRDENDKLNTIRGRVFFEDAEYQPNSNVSPFLSEGPKMPDILSSPKPTSLRTYLEQPGDIDKVGIPFNHWNSPDVRIRGFKRYWHRSDIAARACLSRNVSALDKQDTLIRPVCAERLFKGQVRFENLTMEELGALYASIQLPNGFAHKFGMAKGLGLGSINVKVTERSLFTMKDRYQSFLPNAGKSDNPETILAEAYSKFVRHVCGRQAISLWESKRSLALAALLSWDDQLDPVDTRMVMISNKENESMLYQDTEVSIHNKNQWGAETAIFYSALELFGTDWKRPEDLFPLLEVTDEVENTPERNDVKPDEEPGDMEENVRPTSGKHSLWVTAYPGAKPRIMTEWGERVTCSSLFNSNIPDTAKYLQEDGSVNLMCLAEVTYKNGEAVSARFQRWVEQADLED